VVYHDQSDSDGKGRPKEPPSSLRWRRPQRRTAATSCGERVDLSSDSKAVWACVLSEVVVGVMIWDLGMEGGPRDRMNSEMSLR